MSPPAKPGDYLKEFIDENDSVNFISELGLQNSATKVIKPFSLMIGIRVGIGKCSINTVPMCTSQDIISIENISQDKFHLPFLALLINSKQEYLESQSRGATIQGITSGVLREIDIPFFSLEEQKKIAEVLERVSDLILLRKNQLAKLDELVKSRFFEMFVCKYERRKLGELLKTTSWGTPLKECREYYEGGTIPWLTIGEVNHGIIDSTKNYITEKGLANSSAKIIPANSVVIAMYGATTGQVGLTRLELTTNQAVCSILHSDNFVPEFLYFSVKMNKEWMVNQSVGGAQPNISQTIIKNMPILVAPLNTQSQFAAFVEQTKNTKAAIKQSLNHLEIIKKSMMQEFFG